MIQRNDLLAAASLQSLGPAMLIHHEILQGRQEECAETSLLLVGPAQCVLFEEMFEETLDHVLRVGRRVAATPNKCVERRPIRFAKSGERFLRGFIRIGLSCLQHDSPMRRLKWRTSLL